MLIFQNTYIWVPFVIVLFSQFIMISGLPARFIPGTGISDEEREDRMRKAKVFMRLHGIFGFIVVISLALFLELRWRDMAVIGFIIFFIGVLIAFFGFRLIFSGRIVVHKIDKDK